jgi:hypothetical protein
MGNAFDLSNVYIFRTAHVKHIYRLQDAATVNKVKFTPMWLFQGAKMVLPHRPLSNKVRDAILAAGGNLPVYGIFYTWVMAHGTQLAGA